MVKLAVVLAFVAVGLSGAALAIALTRTAAPTACPGTRIVDLYGGSQCWVPKR